jgi:SAM-dependent methyltransferase
MSIAPDRNEIDIQRRYYAETASHYDDLHGEENQEHSLALSFLLGSIEYLGIRSILDIGSGTGRAIQYLNHHRPDIRVVGVEPVKELREIAYSRGVSTSDLVDGDATALAYHSGEFDLVCEFGVLHHIRRPELAVGEMLRVAAKAIYISDSNNFGNGSATSRFIKQSIRRVGLWPVANFLNTKGKGYTFSQEDGVSYSYSVFNNYKQISHLCSRVHVVNTNGGRINPYRTASHVALLGIK